MPDSLSDTTPSDRVRGIEMRMWEEIGSQLKGFAEAMRDFGADMRDVRERLIRIEAQDQPKKIAQLEVDLSEVQDEIARVEREGDQAIARVTSELHDEIARVERETAAERQKIIDNHAADKLVLEKRLSRTEVIVAPLIALGSAMLVALGAAMISWVQAHVH